MPPIRRGAPLSITASIGQLVHRPRFWRSAEDWRGLPRAQRAALVGLSRVYDLFAAAHAGCVRAQPGQVPTVCVGSVVSGGSGKTPVAQAVACFARALTSGAIEPHLLCRGYGGRERGPLRVERGRHSSCLVGDEPLMHAECAPTWVARSRVRACPRPRRRGRSSWSSTTDCSTERCVPTSRCSSCARHSNRRWATSARSRRGRSASGQRTHSSASTR
mmetsp:Transcript_22482/g.53266  ORF Transcript_22482/g.53266 Transcript_22482/m.53266 type:complete len:218 (-) Transcript_22482:793-1446(-)